LGMVNDGLENVFLNSNSAHNKERPTSRG
jgi:hypothetical protein